MRARRGLAGAFDGRAGGDARLAISAAARPSPRPLREPARAAQDLNRETEDG
jgi:hypothetical protein